MPLSDLPLADLQAYRYPRTPPADLESFWAETLAASRAAGGAISVKPASTSVTAFEISDLTLPGFAGEPIRAWWIRPVESGDRPAVVEFLGYGGGRGLPHERLLWAAHGYHQVVVDTRGQGGMWVPGDTADPHGSGPAAPGFLTKGIESRENLFYRRVFTDAARAVDAVRTLPGIRADRVAVTGHSQGGALALAAAALVTEVRACAARTPFLCGIDRSVAICLEGPYLELATFLGVHRGRAAAALEQLAYIDIALLATLIRCPAWICVGLMDVVCPPSGIFGAINNLPVPPTVVAREFNGHEGGAGFDDAEIAEFFAAALSAGASGGEA